jgi:hypothetical protein
MVKVTERALNQTQVRLFSTSRAIEREIFALHFGEGSERTIISEVRKYQNTDGGFGNGYEPDFRLYASTPMATSRGLEHLHRYGNSPIAQIAINKAIHYLEDTYDEARGGWYAVTPEVNEYDHMPWWHVDEETGTCIIDNNWGNPSIELAGFMSFYRDYLRDFDVDDLVARTVRYIQEKEDYPSFNEVFCMVWFYHLVSDDVKESVFDGICRAVKAVLPTDPKAWREEYLARPLDFVVQGVNAFEVPEPLIEAQLDQEATMINEEFAVLPSWDTSLYIDGMEQALDEWKAILTIETLLHLKERNRLE